MKIGFCYHYVHACLCLSRIMLWWLQEFSSCLKIQSHSRLCSAAKALHAVLKSKVVLVLCIRYLVSVRPALFHLPAQPLSLLPSSFPWWSMSSCLLLLHRSLPHSLVGMRSDTGHQLRNERLVVMTTQTTVLSRSSLWRSPWEQERSPTISL